MTVDELIRELQDCKARGFGSATVRIWDEEEDDYIELTKVYSDDEASVDLGAE